MGVLKNRRGLSKLEFYHNARKMRREITMLVLRDFGIHSRGKKFKEDTGSQQPEGFYDELIAEFAKNVRLLLRNMMWNITAGNTIYPVNEAELQERRMYQDRAIIACEQLHQEILYCEDVIPVKASTFMPYILTAIEKVCATLGIIINRKKTRIVKLENGIEFLKGKYALLKTGKVLKLPGGESAARMRRKLKKFKALIGAGKMSYADLRTAYQSWRGNYMRRFNAYHRVGFMDRLYNGLFINIHTQEVNHGVSGKKR